MSCEDSISLRPENLYFSNGNESLGTAITELFFAEAIIGEISLKTLHLQKFNWRTIISPHLYLINIIFRSSLSPFLETNLVLSILIFPEQWSDIDIPVYSCLPQSYIGSTGATLVTRASFHLVPTTPSNYQSNHTNSKCGPNIVFTWRFVDQSCYNNCNTKRLVSYLSLCLNICILLKWLFNSLFNHHQPTQSRYSLHL